MHLQVPLITVETDTSSTMTITCRRGHILWQQLLNGRIARGVVPMVVCGQYAYNRQPILLSSRQNLVR